MWILLAVYLLSIPSYYVVIRKFLTKHNFEASKLEMVLMFIPVINTYWTIFSLLDLIERKQQPKGTQVAAKFFKMDSK